MNETIWCGDYGVPRYMLDASVEERMRWLEHPVCQRLIYGHVVRVESIAQVLGLTDAQLAEVVAWVSATYADQLRA